MGPSGAQLAWPVSPSLSQGTTSAAETQAARSTYPIATTNAIQVARPLLGIGDCQRGVEYLSLIHARDRRYKLAAVVVRYESMRNPGSIFAKKDEHFVAGTVRSGLLDLTKEK